MFEFDKDFKVFANDELLIPSLSHYNATNKRLMQNYNISSPCAVKVTLDSRNSHLQAVFQCDDMIMCVVNARDKRQPIAFDGFVDENEDECKTKKFCVGTLKELDDEHGLCVRDMVRAMESPTILHIYVNEAIISSSSSSLLSSNNKHNLANCIYDNGVHFNELIHRLRENNMSLQRRRRRRQANLNNTLWAPVVCKTGKLLLMATITFNCYGVGKM
ncbi:Unknown (Ac17) [Spodoptera exigua multiple nucleopolyhedrovirus]|nr:Unknown (Ac17) [Spodoptera exigua multiple nucleopolyhedrovirus]